MTSSSVSLISQWFIMPGRETDAFEALKALAETVRRGEPDTLAYLVHSPLGDPGLQSLPPADPSSVLFFESYRSPEAFLAHVNGPVFLAFVASHGHLFLQAGGKLYTTVFFLERQAGFVRDGSSEHATAAD